MRHTLKTSVKVTDKDSESFSHKLKATVKVRDDKENDIASEGHSDIVVSSNGKVSDVVCRVIGHVMYISDLLIPDTSSTAKSITESTKSLVESTSVSNKGKWLSYL